MMTSNTPPSSPYGLGSLFWSQAEDRCKKVNKGKKSNNGNRALSRRPPRYGKKHDQEFHRPVSAIRNEKPRANHPASFDSAKATTTAQRNVSQERSLPSQPSHNSASFLPNLSPETSRRRVHFSDDQIDHQRTLSQHSSCSTIKTVSSLPWTDHCRGIAGSYTGQVNDDLQPHGSGVLIYDDGAYNSKTCIWKCGIPVRGWRPKKTTKTDDNIRRQEHHEETSSTSSSFEKSEPAKKSVDSTSNDTYLHHLDIGDVASPQDIVQDPDPAKIGCLQMHDFAFVLRSGDRWTYAIIANRQEDQMLLVVDTEGSVKALSKKRWASHIRLVNKRDNNTDNETQSSKSSSNLSASSPAPVSQLTSVASASSPASVSRLTSVPSVVEIFPSLPFGIDGSERSDTLSLFD